MVRILATSDVHSPRYLNMFMKAIEEIREEPNVFIFAGDMVERNNIYALKPIYELVKKRFPGTLMIAVYGNEEYWGFEDRYKREYPCINWLKDEYMLVNVGTKNICFVGTRGALDELTTWQRKNLPGLEKYYRSLPHKLLELIHLAKNKDCSITILISHYGVTYKNLVGEPVSIYPFLASQNLGKTIIDKKLVDLVIHGHAHQGRIEMIEINDVKIYNVSLPARGRIVGITI
ncbi:MAG: metallophosphoesterase [Desulfurococcaceae archaeon]